MARIKGVTDSEANDEVRQFFAEQKKRHGFVSNAAQVSAVRPSIQKGVLVYWSRSSRYNSGIIPRENLPFPSLPNFAKEGLESPGENYPLEKRDHRRI